MGGTDIDGPKSILYDDADNVLVGQKTMAGGLPITIASNQSAIPAKSLAEAILTVAVVGIASTLIGQIATAAVTEVAVRATTYVEQVAGAQRSMVSTSANDTAAGTGARTVQITYYTNTAGVLAGPLTETITLNGLAAVNTVAVNICFIEKLEVLTAGTGGMNAGAINFFTGLAGAGTNFASIAVGARRTLYAHHYIPTGSSCLVNYAWASSTAATANVPTFECRFRDPTSALPGSAERVAIAGLRAQGSNPIAAISPESVVIAGPAVAVWYVTPENGAAQTQRLSATFVEVIP